MTSITVELPNGASLEDTNARRAALLVELRAYWRDQRGPNPSKPSNFLNSLCRQAQNKRVLSPRQVETGFKILAEREEARQRAIQPQPVAPVDLTPRVPAAFGVYRKDGVVYVVKNSRKNEGRRYAVRMVESSARMTQTGDQVKFEFERAPGMVFKLTEEDRLPDVEVHEIMTRYGHCIMCNHAIKRFKSVERMMGPRCWKRMHGMAV